MPPPLSLALIEGKFEGEVRGGAVHDERDESYEEA